MAACSAYIPTADVMGPLLKAFGLEGQPVRAITINFEAESIASVDVKLHVYHWGVYEAVEVLKRFELHEKAQPDPRRTVVFARSLHDYRNHVRDAGLDFRHCTFASSIERVQGISDADLVILPGARQREDWPRMQELIEVSSFGYGNLVFDRDIAE